MQGSGAAVPEPIIAIYLLTGVLVAVPVSAKTGRHSAIWIRITVFLIMVVVWYPVFLVNSVLNFHKWVAGRA